MEAVIINHNFSPAHTLKEVMESFFKAHSPEETKVLFWKFFQCWVTRECKIKADLSDEEVALFFDQLMDLVGISATKPKCHNTFLDELRAGAGL